MAARPDRPPRQRSLFDLCVKRVEKHPTGRGGRGQGGRAGGGGRVRGSLQPQGAAQQPAGRGEVEVVVVVDP
jgi:hypothetical protein